jgi:hypothetical protein
METQLRNPNTLRRLALAWAAISLVACGDPNSKPAYGRDTGLPANCRAYVQGAIDGYRAKKYTADEVMDGLERNCGANGYLWVR